MSAMPPSATRRRKSPIPGLPPGKVENSLCSGDLGCTQNKKTHYGAIKATAPLQRNPHLRNFSLPLLGYSLVTKLEVDDSPTQADGNCLGPVTGAQFIHDVFDMNLDRFLGDEELLRDVPVPVSPCDLTEDLYLPVR